MSVGAADPSNRDLSMRDVFDQLEGEYAIANYILGRLEGVWDAMSPAVRKGKAGFELAQTIRALRRFTTAQQGELMRLRTPED